MAVAIGLVLGFEVAEAEHVYESVHKHWLECRKVGVTEAEKKIFFEQIEKVRRERDRDPEDPDTSLKEARLEVFDGVGAYRTAADLIAGGIAGRQPTQARELQLNTAFPNTDSKMKTYLGGVGGVMKRHSSALAARGFGKDEQSKLVEAGKRYLKLLRVRGRERGEARKTRAGREAMLETLRKETNYFRRAGRAALRTSPMRADFDRLAQPPKAQKKVAPVPVPAPAKPVAA